MRTKTTVLLLLIAAAIGYAVLHFEQHGSPNRQSDGQGGRLLLSFDPARIDGIEIQTADSKIQLAVVDRLWRMGEPIHDVIDPNRVFALLESLSQAEWLEHLPAKELNAEKLRAMGLDKPSAQVRLNSGGRLVAQCWVGNASAIDGAFYLSVPAEGEQGRETYVVRTDMPIMLKKPAENWRDERLLRVPAESVSQIVISSAKGQMEMARRKPKAPWELMRPLQTRGHNERINELLAALLGLEIAQVETESTTETSIPADSLKFVLHTPALVKPAELTILLPADIKTGKAKAWSSLRKGSFAVSSDQLTTLTLQLNDLRDDRLARVDAGTVEMLAIKSSKAGEVKLRKENDIWLLERQNITEPANGDRVAKMFEAFNDHRVKEFVSDSAANLQAYGLDNPFLVVGWNTSEEASSDTRPIAQKGTGFAVEPILGTDTTLLFGQDTQGNVFAKYEDELFVYRVGASVLHAVPRDTVRWKALNPVRFTQFALLRIAISVGTNPPVVLDYDPVSAQWKGSRAGEDISASIDRVKADRLASKLGGLIVEDWAQDRTDGTKALQAPAITVQVSLLNEPGKPSSSQKQLFIHFAPTVANTDTALYYGRVNDGPDIFLVTRDTLRDLLQSVLK